jgi:NAD(P)-dependent dehydrogenase (short-subunit alcohol dehydrogenase family)
MRNLTGKVIVVTGGASGIGLGMARAFAGAGMKLVIADLDDVQFWILTHLAWRRSSRSRRACRRSVANGHVEARRRFP